MTTQTDGLTAWQRTIQHLFQPPSQEADPYDMGYDCGKNGPNTTNCNFQLFRTPEMTREWERGKRAGEKAKRP